MRVARWRVQCPDNGSQKAVAEAREVDKKIMPVKTVHFYVHKSAAQQLLVLAQTNACTWLRMQSQVEGSSLLEILTN